MINFSSKRQISATGIEYGLARDLPRLLGSTKGDNFVMVISKAQTSCEVSGRSIADHFANVGKMVDIGAAVWRQAEQVIPSAIADHAKPNTGWSEEDKFPGFCFSASRENIQEHGYVLTPGRYVGAEAAEEDAEPFDEKMKRLTGQLSQQMEKGRELDEAIKANFKSLGWEI